MKLHVIGSNSLGNAYVLQNENEALLIEAGCNFMDVKKSLGFNLSKVAGCLITHEHGDHCKHAKDVKRSGIEIYASRGTHEKLTLPYYAHNIIKPKQTIHLGGFKILGFDIEHDAAEPLGFLIEHRDCGRVLFLTDTYYSRYTFPKLNQVIIECNYMDSVIEKNMPKGSNNRFLRNRILESHMSLRQCIETLKANDLSQVQNIVLIHLSDGNSHEVKMQKAVEKATGKITHVANKGSIFNLSK